MNLIRLVKTTALIAAISAGVLFWTKFDLSSTGCQRIAEHLSPRSESLVLPCANLQQTSWLSWFSGQSRSAQFHFIDLLELLSRFQTKPTE